MIIPPFLASGKTIGIVAPGRKVLPDEISEAIKTIESWGLNVVLGKNIFSTTHSYLSGGDKERAEDMQSMLDDANIAAIFCARGGYGTTRFIEQLDFSTFLNNPKWIVGFSDVTALHLRLSKLGVESIHAIMPILFGKQNSEQSIESLGKILWGEKIALDWQVAKFNRTGKSDGIMIGGNLSLIVDSIGTSGDIDTTGKILMIEEVEEYRYKIDRMMTQLKRSGKLENLAGLIVGHMTNILDTELSFGETVNEIIISKVKEYTYPVAFSFPSGHEMPNMAWRHGGHTLLEVTSEKASIKMLKG
jgi:muramoyltetrapeptide carboxypeptidase